MTNELNELQVAIHNAWPDRRPMPDRLVRALSAAQKALRKAGVEPLSSRADQLEQLQAEVRRMQRQLGEAR